MDKVEQLNRQIKTLGGGFQVEVEGNCPYHVKVLYKNGSLTVMLLERKALNDTGLDLLLDGISTGIKLATE